VAGGSGVGVMGGVEWVAGVSAALVVAIWLLEAEADERDELLNRLEESLLGVGGCSNWCAGGLCELSAIKSETLGAIGDCRRASGRGPVMADDETQDPWLCKYS
jgi:hypothetical protein